MCKKKIGKIIDVKVKGNILRFVNIHKGSKDEFSIVIESGHIKDATNKPRTT